MKTTISVFLLSLVTSFCYSQDNPDYEIAMKNGISSIEMAATAGDFINLANIFERIAGLNANEWLPLYYACYSYINLAFVSGDIEKIDAYLDKGQKFLDKAMALSPGNDELFVLQGFLYQGRIQADPMGRGMQFSMKANEVFGMAQGINPNNPRIYFLQAQNLYYTPEAFGGGAETACPLFSKAAQKYTIFVPEGPFFPAWGQDECMEMLYSHCDR